MDAHGQSPPASNPIVPTHSPDDQMPDMLNTVTPGSSVAHKMPLQRFVSFQEGWNTQ
jgi:hypothetical protein